MPIALGEFYVLPANGTVVVLIPGASSEGLRAFRFQNQPLPNEATTWAQDGSSLAAFLDLNGYVKATDASVTVTAPPVDTTVDAA